ncbi:MAG: 3-oxo-5a-steroid 4- dehydrogenase [Cirrosporium novae-zelandiae]|nr:MAG: 3-oxo-5a-steroid 4- dehydrogenase [Cirrosporium novae-zelandiae]
MQLIVKPRGVPIKTLPSEVTTSAEDNASHLYSKLSTLTGLSQHRLRITKGSDGSVISPDRDLTIGSTGLQEESTIYVKDLGPQIAWRTVFIIEYLGPIIIHPLLYLLLAGPTPTPLQTLSLTLIVVHFVKRELEGIFIHRFSLATMPIRNVFKNSAHYWLLAGLNIAYWIYIPTSPTAAPPDTKNPLITYAGLTLFLLSEFANLNSHLTLRNLRRPGSTDRGIPHGFGFGLVTCPNYMFETLAWVGVAIVSRSWSVVVFTVVAVAQMGAWAWKKEKRYRKEFGDKYKRKRYAILPGLW